MNTGRARRRWAGWLALLVIGLAMLAPTVSRALARGPAGALRAGWIEVCTPGGVRWIQLDRDATDKESAPAAPSLNDCPLCLLAWDRLAPPPAFDAAALALRSDLTQAAPPSAAAAAHPALRTLAGRPRGPPPATRPVFVA